MLDPTTGRIRVRYVEIKSEAYETFHVYMIRLKPEDFDDPAMVASLAKAGNMSEREFLSRFKPLIAAGCGLPGHPHPSPLPWKGEGALLTTLTAPLSF
jgi:hypothetical protein